MQTLHPENWVSLYADYLLQYAMFRLNDEALCEDLVQETFFSALKARDNFKGNSSEKTWLTSILKNKIVDEYRKKSKRPEGLNEDTMLGWFFEHSDEEDAHWRTNAIPQPWENTVLDKIQQKEYYAILRGCIQRLNQKHIDILQEKYFEDASSEKICKEFNLSKSNYWVTMHRINLTLRSCLEHNWFKK
ncbi:MAG: sigma-70 family RNA polymerase sigma factor [Chitinophagaceae bacterium]|nr:sigma-70 family RNA polymerase sigma factor [Chitinophagaceae bacterium]